MEKEQFYWGNKLIGFINLLQEKQFWNGKSQKLPDFLQTMGYVKKINPKQSFGKLDSLSSNVREGVSPHLWSQLPM
jgi:hypothetical protein